MKDLFFKDLSDKVLSKHCGKKKAHPHSIHSYTGVVRPKIYPTTETKGRGTPIARRILILRSSVVLLSGRTIECRTSSN